MLKEQDCRKDEGRKRGTGGVWSPVDPDLFFLLRASLQVPTQKASQMPCFLRVAAPETLGLTFLS